MVVLELGDSWTTLKRAGAWFHFPGHLPLTFSNEALHAVSHAAPHAWEELPVDICKATSLSSSQLPFAVRHSEAAGVQRALPIMLTYMISLVVLPHLCLLWSLALNLPYTQGTFTLTAVGRVQKLHDQLAQV